MRPVLQGLGHFVTRFWGALLSVFPDILQMNTWQIRALDNFVPDHTLCVKLLDLELVLLLRLATSKTASGRQRERL